MASAISKTSMNLAVLRRSVKYKGVGLANSARNIISMLVAVLRPCLERRLAMSAQTTFDEKTGVSLLYALVGEPEISQIVFLLSGTCKVSVAYIVTELP